METVAVIRLAIPADIPALVELTALLFTLEKDFAVDHVKQQQGLNMFFESPSGRCLLVAEYQQKVVGMCSAQLLVSTAAGGWKALVEDVIVAEEYRGKGIASKLLQALEEWALGYGVKRLDLLADCSNTAALHFYEKMLWKRTSLIGLQKSITQ